MGDVDGGVVSDFPNNGPVLADPVLIVFEYLPITTYRFGVNQRAFVG